MASSTEERQIAFKHTLDVYGARSDRQWFEETYGAKHVVIAQNVWAQKPFYNDPTGSITQGLVLQETDFVLTLDPFSAGRVWVAKNSPGIWPYAGLQTDWTSLDASRVRNWLSPIVFGPNYWFVLKQGDGSLIPTGNWEWQFSEGLLHLDDGFTAVDMGWITPLKLACYRYTGSYLAGDTTSAWTIQEWSATQGQISFILLYPVLVAESFSLSVNGVEYVDGVDFIRNGQTITWSNTAFVIGAGDYVVARYLRG
jgi:hypothetical protein